MFINALVVKKAVYHCLSSEPLWNMSHLRGACHELQIPCKWEEDKKDELKKLVDSLVLDTEANNINVVELTDVFVSLGLKLILKLAEESQYCHSKIYVHTY